MLRYFFKRLLGCVLMLCILAFVSFLIIDLPPGDYLSTYIASMQASGRIVEEGEILQLRERYGLDKPLMTQFVTWIHGIFTRGDFGYSFSWNRPVSDILAERIPLTMAISITCILFNWIVAVPISIYSATHKYSLGDYLFNIVGFIGLAVPGFLLALVIVYLLYVNFGFSISGLFSDYYALQPWSFNKLVDLLKHVWLPILIIGAEGTASLVRILRGTLIDELPRQYTTTARAKGLPEKRMLMRYPVRVAINPAISTIGWTLPRVFSGEVLVSTVLNLETIGPVFTSAVKMQDMYLAGSVLLILCACTLIGTVISDLLLAALDPRIRMGGEKK